MCLPRGLLLEVQQKLNLSTYPQFSWEALATGVQSQALVYFADMIRDFSKYTQKIERRGMKLICVMECK